MYRLELTGRIAYPDNLVPRFGSTEGEARSRFQRQNNRLFLPPGMYDTPEVILGNRQESGTAMVAAGQGFWFQVPEGTDAFWIDFQTAGRGRAPVNRVCVWNPDGERVYDQSYTGDPPPRVQIEVPAAHAGKLWRATGGSFVVDPQIPPYFSLSRSKWFDPEGVD